jgi:hypothetical protein
MKVDSESETRPAVFLWLVSSFTFYVFPLSLVLNTLMVKFGLKEDTLTFLSAVLLSILIFKWYNALDAEVNEYLDKKYGKDQ